MKSFDLDKFRGEFLKSDGWQVSDVYKPYEDKFLRRDAQDAYEGAKWGFNEGAQSRQSEVDELTGKLKNSEYLRDEHLEARRRLYKDNCELQKLIDNALSKSKDFYDFGDCESAMAFCNEIINILKGEQNA